MVCPAQTWRCPCQRNGVRIDSICLEPEETIFYGGHHYSSLIRLVVFSFLSFGGLTKKSSCFVLNRIGGLVVERLPWNLEVVGWVIPQTLKIGSGAASLLNSVLKGWGGWVKCGEQNSPPQVGELGPQTPGIVRPVSHLCFLGPASKQWANRTTPSRNVQIYKIGEIVLRKQKTPWIIFGTNNLPLFLCFFTVCGGESRLFAVLVAMATRKSGLWA